MPMRSDQRAGFSAERAVAMLAVGAILAACLWIALPLLSVLAWGALIAISLAPLHRLLARAFGGGQKAAAVVLVLALLLLVIVPLSFLPHSIEQAVKRLSALTTGGTSIVLPPAPVWLEQIPLIGPKLQGFWMQASANSSKLLEYVQPYLGPAVQWIAVQGANLGIAVLQMILAIVLAGIFLSTEAKTTPTLQLIADRVGGRPGGDLLIVAVRTVRSVSQGVIGTALLQGILSGIGFAMAGVSYAVALAALSFVTAMMQLGTWLVWIPIALWQSYQGETGWALFTAVLGVFINVLDNVVKPILIGRRAGAPMWVIFIGVLGGVLTLGLIGIFVGPLITAVAYSLLTIWLSQQIAR